MSDSVAASDEELRTLAVAAGTGDELAWRRLWSLVEPRLLAIVSRPRFLGRVSTREDECRDIVVEVMARLHADDCRRLRMFAEAAERDPELPFMPWLTVVTKRVGIDYLRAHAQFLGGRGRPSDSRPAWAHPTTLNDVKVGGRRPPVTRSGTAHELLERAGTLLSPEQKAAVELWLCGHRHDEIAGELGLEGGRDAERLVRAGLERIRRAVRKDPEQP